MKHHSPRRQRGKRRRRRWLTRCVLGLLVAAAAVLLFVHVRGDDNELRGAVFAAGHGLRVSGSGNSLSGTSVASRILVSGDGNDISDGTR